MGKNKKNCNLVCFIVIISAIIVALLCYLTFPKNKNDSLIRINEQNIKVKIGETRKIDYFLGKSNYQIKWTSSNDKFIVNELGEVTANDYGVSTINATINDNGKLVTSSCTVISYTGEIGVEVNKIEKTDDVLQMKENSDNSLPFTIVPNNAYITSLNYYSSNEDVAYVSNNKIISKNEGEATITIKINNTISNSINVKVIKEKTDTRETKEIIEPTKETETKEVKEPTKSTQPKETKYTITFNPNGGKVSVGSKTIKYKDNYGSLPTPTRTGYVFIGWFTSNSSTFNSMYYADNNLDVRNAFGYDYQNLLIHWLDYGMSEGRNCSDTYRKHTSIYNKNTNETLYAGWVSLSTLYNNKNWNKYSITYSSSVPLKGTIVYKSSRETEAYETFFLESGTNKTFNSYINYWVDNNIATGIKSIKVVDLNGKEIDAISNIKLTMGSTSQELLNKYSYPNKDYNSKTVFIKNDYLTLGISIEWGGTVTYLSGTNKTFNNSLSNKNIVNTWDTGREIQTAFYGNKKYKNESWGPIGAYNLVQGGYTKNDKSYGSKVVDINIDNNNKIITVISRPLLWSLTNKSYIKEHEKEYSGYVSESYIYQTYKLVDNKIELTQSYIDFSNNYSDYNNCAGQSCPRAEVPCIYTTSNLNIVKYNDSVTGKNQEINRNSTFSDQVHKVSVFYSRYAGVYNSSNQGIGIYIRNLESFLEIDNNGKYKYGESPIYFHTNFNFIRSVQASSTADDTIILYLLQHAKYKKAERVKLPQPVIVLGTYNDLVSLSSKYK